MQVLEKSVLLLRADDSDSKYEDKLKTHGYDPKTIRTLEFVFSKLEELGTKLRQPQIYDGLIFTTPRAVSAVRAALGDNPLDSVWLDRTIYAVGNATGDAAFDVLGVQCVGSQSGSAANLAEYILGSEVVFQNRRLLFPCGSLATDTLTNRLNDGDIALDAVTVYRTEASTSLASDFEVLTAGFSVVPQVFVFFSPSGVNGTLTYVKRIQQEISAVKFVAIGKTTAGALEKVNLPVDAVCAAPTPDELVTALDTLFS